MTTAATRAGLPEEQQEALRKAVRLEWISIVYVISAVILVLLVMGSSQAMRAAWLEDMLSLLPPISFLIARRVLRARETSTIPTGGTEASPSPTSAVHSPCWRWVCSSSVIPRCRSWRPTIPPSGR